MKQQIETYPVEKAIPIPPIARRSRPTRARYPWRTMEVGDSFLVPLIGEPLLIVEQRVWRAAYAHRLVVTVRYEPERLAVRVWLQGRR
jgi:hypothetical protein